MTKKRVSIKDIAQAAGVSHPTVSRALRGEGRMSDDTRARIVDLAATMGYTPSLIARGLVTQRSLSVGLVVTNIADPFHGEIAQGIEEVALQHGYSIFLASTTVDPVREMEVARSLLARQVDGILATSSRVGQGYAALIREAGIPVVLISPHVDGGSVPTVVHANQAGMRRLVHYLVEQGHRRIAYLDNRRGGIVHDDRLTAWRETLTAAGLDASLVVAGPTGRYQGGRLAAQQLLTLARDGWGGLPDAVCCYNDTMAIGAAAVLREAGIHIPAQMALTGFDDIDVAAYLDPPLTTWRQPRRAMGAAAMEMMLVLLNRVDDAPIAVSERVMHGELVVRQSTLPSDPDHHSTATRGACEQANAVHQ